MENAVRPVLIFAAIAWGIWSWSNHLEEQRLILQCVQQMSHLTAMRDGIAIEADDGHLGFGVAHLHGLEIVEAWASSKRYRVRCYQTHPPKGLLITHVERLEWSKDANGQTQGTWVSMYPDEHPTTIGETVQRALGGIEEAAEGD